MIVVVRSLNGASVHLEHDRGDTVADILTRLQNRNGVPAQLMDIVFQSKILSPNSTLEEVGLVSESAVYLLYINKKFSSQFSKITNNVTLWLFWVLQKQLPKDLCMMITSSNAQWKLKGIDFSQTKFQIML